MFCFRLCLIAGLIFATLSQHFELRAQTLRNNRFATGWLIGPPVSQESRRFKDGGRTILAESRLIPQSLVALNTSVVAADGTEILPKDAQLHAIYRGQVDIFCSAQTKSASLMWLWAKIQQQYKCFVDKNRDGLLDAHYMSSSSIDGFPAIKEAPPRELISITPVRLRTIDSEAFSEDLRIRLSCQNGGQKGHTLHVEVTGSGKPAELVDYGSWQSLPIMPDVTYLGEPKNGKIKCENVRVEQGAFTEGEIRLYPPPRY